MACSSFRFATSARRWPRFCRRRGCTAVPPWHKIDARRFRTGHAAGGCALQSAVSVLLIDTRTGAGYQAHRYHSNREGVYLQLNKIKTFQFRYCTQKRGGVFRPFFVCPQGQHLVIRAQPDVDFDGLHAAPLLSVKSHFTLRGRRAALWPAPVSPARKVNSYLTSVVPYSSLFKRDLFVT